MAAGWAATPNQIKEWPRVARRPPPNGWRLSFFLFWKKLIFFSFFSIINVYFLYIFFSKSDTYYHFINADVALNRTHQMF